MKVSTKMCGTAELTSEQYGLLFMVASTGRGKVAVELPLSRDADIEALCSKDLLYHSDLPDGRDSAGGYMLTFAGAEVVLSDVTEW